MTTPAAAHPVSIFDAHLRAAPYLRLRLFYPTVPCATAHPAHWFPPSPTSSTLQDETLLSVLRFAGLPFPPLLAPLFSALPRQPLPATLSTPPLPPPAPPLPLVLLSHGLGGSVANYCALALALARQGFLVAAPEHTDASAFAAYPAHTPAACIPYKRFAPDWAFRKRQLETRRADLDAVLHAIRAVANGDDALVPLDPRVVATGPPDFSGRVDTRRVVVAGHSFGAATALSYAPTRPVVASVVCLDAWLAPLGDRFCATADLGERDVLFVDQALSGMADSVALRETLPPVTGDAIADAVKVVGGMHNNSSDFPMRVPKVVAVAARMTARGSDPELLLQRQNDAVVEFLKGRREWVAFRDKVRRGEVPGLALASLGAARVLARE